MGYELRFNHSLDCLYRRNGVLPVFLLALCKDKRKPLGRAGARVELKGLAHE